MNKKNIVLALLSIFTTNGLFAAKQEPAAQATSDFNELYNRIKYMKNTINEQSKEIERLKSTADENTKVKIEKFSSWLQKFSQNVAKFEEGLQKVISNRSTWLLKMSNNIEKFKERFEKFQENLEKQPSKNQAQPAAQPVAQGQPVAQPVTPVPAQAIAQPEKVVINVKLPNGTVKQATITIPPGTSPEQKKQKIEQVQKAILAGKL